MRVIATFSETEASPELQPRWSLQCQKEPLNLPHERCSKALRDKATILPPIQPCMHEPFHLPKAPTLMQDWSLSARQIKAAKKWLRVQ